MSFITTGEGESSHLIRSHEQRSIWLRARPFTHLLELSWRQTHDQLSAETLGHESKRTPNAFWQRADGQLVRGPKGTEMLPSKRKCTQWCFSSCEVMLTCTRITLPTGVRTCAKVTITELAGFFPPNTPPSHTHTHKMKTKACKTAPCVFPQHLLNLACFNIFGHVSESPPDHTIRVPSLWNKCMQTHPLLATAHSCGIPFSRKNAKKTQHSPKCLQNIVTCLGFYWMGLNQKKKGGRF